MSSEAQVIWGSQAASQPAIAPSDRRNRVCRPGPPRMLIADGKPFSPQSLAPIPACFCQATRTGAVGPGHGAKLRRLGERAPRRTPNPKPHGLLGRFGTRALQNLHRRAVPRSKRQRRVGHELLGQAPRAVWLIPSYNERGTMGPPDLEDAAFILASRSLSLTVSAK